MPLLGAAQIVELTGGTFAMKDASGSAVAGYISPNLQTFKLNHSGERKSSKNQSGKTNAIYLTDEQLECTFDAIPEDTTSTYLAIADAKAAARLPVLGGQVTISGLPVIAVGGFSDALNGTWLYEGGGSINGVNDDKWTMSIPLKRYEAITPSAPAA